MTDTARLSLNLITVDHWSLGEAVERCAAAGIEWVAPWRHQYEDAAARSCLAIIREHSARIDGIKISLLDEQREIDFRARLPEGVRL